MKSEHVNNCIPVPPYRIGCDHNGFKVLINDFGACSGIVMSPKEADRQIELVMEDLENKGWTITYGWLTGNRKLIPPENFEIWDDWQ
jgi:hypothetical protein